MFISPEFMRQDPLLNIFVNESHAPNNSELQDSFPNNLSLSILANVATSTFAQTNRNSENLSDIELVNKFRKFQSLKRHKNQQSKTTQESVPSDNDKHNVSQLHDNQKEKPIRKVLQKERRKINSAIWRKNQQIRNENNQKLIQDCDNFFTSIKENLIPKAPLNEFGESILSSISTLVATYSPDLARISLQGIEFTNKLNEELNSELNKKLPLIERKRLDSKIRREKEKIQNEFAENTLEVYLTFHLSLSSFFSKEMYDHLVNPENEVVLEQDAFITALKSSYMEHFKLLEKLKTTNSAQNNVLSSILATSAIIVGKIEQSNQECVNKEICLTEQDRTQRQKDVEEESDKLINKNNKLIKLKLYKVNKKRDDLLNQHKLFHYEKFHDLIKISLSNLPISFVPPTLHSSISCIVEAHENLNKMLLVIKENYHKNEAELKTKFADQKSVSRLYRRRKKNRDTLDQQMIAAYQTFQSAINLVVSTENADQLPDPESQANLENNHSSNVLKTINVANASLLQSLSNPLSFSQICEDEGVSHSVISSTSEKGIKRKRHIPTDIQPNPKIDKRSTKKDSGMGEDKTLCLNTTNKKKKVAGKDLREYHREQAQGHRDKIKQKKRSN